MIDIINIIIISLLPGFEGRYAIIYGLLKGLDLSLVITISITCTITLSTLLTLFVSNIDSMLSKLALNNSSISKLVRRYLERVNRIRDRISVKIRKYGIAILILFIAIPIPGTGVWTGALLAYMLKLKTREMLISLILGGTLSIAVTSSLYFLGEEIIKILM
ncbi:MAG: ligand-binding protein SH3 [Thermoprotei archaeon ex4572_64]|nr:MAG: ligand-binding protein SH3 [Thermoprotei archaeon ex4572_64]